MERVIEMRDSFPRSRPGYAAYLRRDYADYLILDIRNYQEDSLAHLCLPTTVRHPLYRNRVKTISQLRDILPLLSEEKMRGLGRKAYEVIVQRLADFDRLLAEYQSQNQPQS